MNEKEMIEELAEDLKANIDCDYGGIYYRESAENLYTAGYRKIPEGSVVLDRQEHQKYCAYKIIEPQIKGCLDRERELEKQVAELEDKIENGMLFELPCVRKINNALGSYEAVYINERDLVQESLVLTPEQGWLIIRKYACPKHQAEAENKLKELKGE